MKTTLKQVEIDRTVDNDDIEKALRLYGEPLRWAVVRANEKKFTVEAVFIE
ncbi:MAG: hypothetical protein K6A44_05925 [bacterium]|nr:hypothetical protein [bacterium]